MSNIPPSSTSCYVLRSCTDGNTTVLSTNVIASPLLAQYAISGQHIKISNVGYTGICFSVELIESGCLDCSNSVTITPIVPNPVCNCDVVYNYYVLTPCDQSLPSFYTAQNLYPYDGTTITFFGQGGVCYTVTGSINIPQGISVIGVQCPETCSCSPAECGCPEGYVLNEETGLCDGFIETSPTASQYILEVIPGTADAGTYGKYGTDFYANIDLLPKPLSNLPFITPVPPDWPYTELQDALGIPCIISNTIANSLWKGRLNLVGIWGSGFQPGVSEGPIGFSFCLDFPETKEYYFGIGADDFANISIDGVLILDASNVGFNFTNWKVLPITITAGQHIIELITEDIASVSSTLGFEIYNTPSYAILQACTTSGGAIGVPNPGNPTDLNQYILFSTLEKKSPLGQTWDTGLYYNFNCPDGYILSTCGLPICIQQSSIPLPPCEAWQITFCDGLNLDPIITNTDLTQYIGAVYTICYDDDGDQVCGCGSVSRVDTQIAPAFTGTFSTIFYDCCEKCTQVCYLLEDCQGAVDPIVTCTDLSNYVNQIVKLSNCGDICWKVSESNTCDGSILLGTVIENFVPSVIEGKVCIYETNISPEFVTFISLQITINNTLYVVDFTTFSDLFVDLNNLGLGTFNLSGSYLAVAGNENYGLMCLVRTGKPKICTEPVCSTYTKYCTYKPVRLTAAPDYKIPFATFTIIINGITYTGNIPSQEVDDFFIYLNSLNLGVFTRVITAPVFLSVKVYGNENYGNIQFGGVISDPTCFENENLDFAQACTDCLPPLPPAPVLDLHLRRIKPGYFSTNSCITTEYMDRVNCNFAKQVYDAMLIKRYGITVCCDHDVDTWDIKKQGLDFELLGDPNLCKSTLCYCPAPCLVGVVFTLLPTCVAPILVEATLDTLCYPAILVDATITVETTPLPCNCYILEGTDYTVGWIDCCCVYQSATFTANATVCGHYTPVVLSGTVTITAAADCGGALCVAPPPISCDCYIVTAPSQDTPYSILHRNCTTGVLETTITSGGTYYLCSQILPYSTGPSLSFTTNALDCALGECVAPPPPCLCWGITPEDKTTITVTFDTCDGVPVTINNVVMPVEMCSPVAPVVVGSYVMSSPTICNLDCGIIPGTSCACYAVEIGTTGSIATVQIQTNLCVGGGTTLTTITSSDPILYICSARCPKIITTTPNATVTITMHEDWDCSSGVCAPPL